MSQNVSNMYERVGNCSAHLDKRIPRSYSALILPSKQELKCLGLSDSSAAWGANRDHPYAKWQTFSFEKGTSAQEALGIVEAFNTSNDRVIKIRITFSDGTHISLQRRVPARPDTLKAVGTYDPNEVFKHRTEQQSSVSRSDYLKRTMPIVNEKGHLVRRRADSLSSFAPERLFADCPINDPPQTSFAFTPVGYNSYMVRPNYRIPGCKPTIASFSETAYAYRPRGFGNSEFPNHEEITGRNEVSKPRSVRAGENLYTGSFLRQTLGKGAPLSPSFLRNTSAGGTMNNSYHNTMEARRSIQRAHSASVARYNNSVGRSAAGRSNNNADDNDNKDQQQQHIAGLESIPRATTACPKRGGGGQQQRQGVNNNNFSTASNASSVNPPSLNDYHDTNDHGAAADDNVYNYESNNSPSKVVLSPGGKVRVHYKD